MSGGGKGKQKSTSTSTVKVPKYLSKELQYGVEQARSLYDQGAPAYYPDQTYADFTPAQIEAMNSTMERGRYGSDVGNAAQGYATDVLEGNYLNDNPYLDQIMQRYGAQANSQVLGAFNKSGRLGSSANVATAAQSVGDATLPFLFQNYGNERNMQQAAAAMAPQLADMDYTDLAAMAGVGDAQQMQNQRGIDEKMNRYNYDAQAPSMWLDNYLQRINQSGANNLTTTQNTTTQKSGGGLGSVLGGALSIGSMFLPGGALASTALGLGSAGGLGFGLATGGQGFLSGGISNAINSARGFYGPGF